MTAGRWLSSDQGLAVGGVNLKKIFFVLMAVIILGNVLYESGVMGAIPAGVYGTILLVLSGVVLFLLRNIIFGSEFGDGDDKIFGDSLGESGPRGTSRSLQVIHHESSWKVVARGRSLGVFKSAPIPAWIRTSDRREADYCGVSNAPLPEKCTCIEIPERSELIVPPGLIYTIRS